MLKLSSPATLCMQQTFSTDTVGATEKEQTEIPTKDRGTVTDRLITGHTDSDSEPAMFQRVYEFTSLKCLCIIKHE